MSKLFYPAHYKLRLFINHFFYRFYSRIFYREMMPHWKIFKAQSFSLAAVKFLKIAIKEHILSESELINSQSIVFDVGGDTGVWAMEIYEKYKPKLFIFEPNMESITELKKNFSGTDSQIFNFGLGSKNTQVLLSANGMGSSIFEVSPGYDEAKKFEIKIKDINDVFKELALNEIDLIKINIEGGEYDLVPRIIETGIINKCRIIRIQFHDWIPDAFTMRKKIVKQLAKTHDVEWSYPMVWESWIRKDIIIKKISI